MDIDKLTQRLAKALNRETNALEERLEKIRSVKDALYRIGGGASGNVGGNGRKKQTNGRRKRHTMSLAGRRAIAKAQRLRWAKIKKEQK